MSSLGIVSPGYAAASSPSDQAVSGSSGVADHTARLLQSWTRLGHQVSVSGDLDQPANLVVDRWADRQIQAILIQYVPFMYGRRGLSRFPEELAIAARRRGIRVTAFIHEPWVPLSRPQWLILGPLQRLQLHRIMGQVSGAATAVPKWRKLLAPSPTLVYVGSTLADASSSPAPPLVPPTPVVFSPFAAGLRWPWILAAARAIGAPSGLTIIGATEDEAAAHPVVGRLLQPGWDWRGRLPPEDAIPLLRAARLVLAPFIDGLTGRRTSACAALSTGTRVLSSWGHLADPFFREIVPMPEDQHAFAAQAVKLWADPDSQEERTARLAWYNRNLHPNVLDERLLQLMLQNSSTRSGA